jgi:hypothetical protein
MEPVYVCDFFTLISSVPVDQSRGLPNFCVCVKFTLKLARFKCICDGLSKN